MLPLLVTSVGLLADTHLSAKRPDQVRCRTYTLFKLTVNLSQSDRFKGFGLLRQGEGVI